MNTKMALREYIAEHGPVDFSEPCLALEDRFDADVWTEMADLVEADDVEQTEDGYIILGETSNVVADPEDLQVKKDLGDYARSENVFEAVGGTDAYGRTPVVRKLLPEADVRVRSIGSYQGTMIFVIEGYGYYWIIKEAYGSCGVCDGFIDAPNYEYGLSMLRNAYAFKSADDARIFLSEIEGWSWDDVRDDGIELLDEITDTE